MAARAVVRLNEGTKGKINVDRSELTSEPGAIVDEPLEENAIRVYHSDNHMRNWLNCVFSREIPICDVEIGHRSASICHLANIGYRVRRTLNWDPKKEVFLDDPEANKYADRDVRDPWTL